MENFCQINICSVGDLMICDSPLYASVGLGSRYKLIKDKLFADCDQYFRRADLVIGNFEGCIYTPKKKNLKELQMSCGSNVLADLNKHGFDILNIANNHCMQHGVDSFINAKSICIDKGIEAIGYKDEEPYIVEKDGLKLIFLSLCLHYERYDPEHILYEDDINRILSVIETEKQHSSESVIVLSIHWGDEYATYPSNAQIALAHRFVDMGVDIILGHHAHVFQGIERYKDSIVVYGQGNFVSDMKLELCRETAIVNLTIKIGDGIRQIDYNLIPYYINDEYILEPYNLNWFDERQKDLKVALCGESTDEEYWKRISKNHNAGHDSFRNYFLKNILRYRPMIMITMIFDFVKRKIHRASKHSTFGVNGSYDPEIYKALGRQE